MTFKFAVHGAVSMLLAGLLAVACASAGGAGATSGAPSTEIARVHRAKCGACHVRVEPGERSRSVIESALARHRKRVSLREEQWAAMVEYLAPDPATAPASAR